MSACGFTEESETTTPPDTDEPRQSLSFQVEEDTDLSDVEKERMKRDGHLGMQLGELGELGEPGEQAPRDSCGKPSVGNRYIDTKTDGTQLHQGDKVLSGFSNENPAVGSGHVFTDTCCTGGSLQQGNKFQPKDNQAATQSPEVEHSYLQKHDYVWGKLEEEGTEADDDLISPGWTGCVPSRIGNHEYETTTCKGGSLRRGTALAASS